MSLVSLFLLISLCLAAANRASDRHPLESKIHHMSRVVVVMFNNRDDVIKVRLKGEGVDSIGSIDRMLSRECPELLVDKYHLEYLDRLSGKFVPLNETSISEMASTPYSTIIVIADSPAPNTASPLCIDGRAFDIQDGLPIGSRNLRISIGEVDMKAELGTGLITWDGAVVLAKYLDVHRELVQRRSVLELGAGTGLSGIAAAVLGASSVLLTDLEYTVKNLRRNVDRNADVIAAAIGEAAATSTTLEVASSSSSCSSSSSSSTTTDASSSKNIDIAVLDWANSSTYRRGPHDVAAPMTGFGSSPSATIIRDATNSSAPTSRSSSSVTEYSSSSSAVKDTSKANDHGWDVVIGADIVWLEELVPLLVTALEAVCSEHTLLLLSHQKRSERTDSLLFHLLDKQFDIQKIPASEYHPEFQTAKISIYQGRKKNKRSS